MRILSRWILLMAALVLVATMALSQPQQAATQLAKPAASANQRAADLLDTINQNEISAAQAVESHSQNDQVKDLAKTIASDHQDAQDKLQWVAQHSNLSLHASSKMQDRNQKMVSRLQSESPAAADIIYLRDVVRGHKSAIAELEKLQSEVTDPQLKGCIQGTLPEMRKHRDAAPTLLAQLHPPKQR